MVHYITGTWTKFVHFAYYPFTSSPKSHPQSAPRCFSDAASTIMRVMQIYCLFIVASTEPCVFYNNKKKLYQKLYLDKQESGRGKAFLSQTDPWKNVDNFFVVFWF